MLRLIQSLPLILVLASPPSAVSRDNPTTPTAASACLVGPSAAETDYAADIDFALDQLEQQCGHFFDLKQIDWKKVSKQFKKEAKDVETDQQHLVLLVRLLARLEDGHAQVRPLPAGEDVRWPEEPERTGPGIFLCESGGKVYLKNVWNDAADLGLEPGMEVVAIDGVKAGKWLDGRVETLSDTLSFSTDHQARFYAMHQGLAQEVGTRMDVELKTLERKKKQRTITYRKSNPTPWGPAFYPEGLKSTDDLNYGLLPSGHGYVQVRRCKDTVVEQMDTALAALGQVPGLVLDFRGNSGGGFDHEQLLGRFVPEGYTLEHAKPQGSTGANQYGGPIVVIVDATCRSAGETGAGMFKEDGRAYMIGESPTAGMSSSKTTIDLPSGLFSLYVSVASNKGRFNDGRGIEGIGVIPHELVEYDPEDLAESRDTLIERAAALLDDFPQREVSYDPKDAGWEHGG
ncbi:S41 family peptidase [Engelhardtia mirabilis]|uniref:Peptidase family S41 n=1 Tax=Engelhardtia mirabilis TaxID=2528011 RepID=A0A518BIP3_9BACT|nr:Peptidase family S41 [Planctomycetes bacterium Pla133]QDV01162.1 Peptidase family S41 [Planctomycetes bacterium Pla86]